MAISGIVPSNPLALRAPIVLAMTNSPTERWKYDSRKRRTASRAPRVKPE
jgi:hypothetical protein